MVEVFWMVWEEWEVLECFKYEYLVPIRVLHRDVMVWYGSIFYTEGIHLTLAHSSGDFLTSPWRKRNIYGATTFIPKDSI